MHIPVLRAGKPYKSLNTVKVKDFRSNETVAELSQANGGLIRKDFRQASENQRQLQAIPAEKLIEICKNAAGLFMQADLPLDGESQSPDTYIKMLSLTTGMPKVLCRKNMDKIHKVLVEMRAVVGGLTRGLDVSILDKGWGSQEGRNLSFQVQCNSLGAILPNNSPGVHTLWLPSIPLKVPLMLKPGSQEPWTPYRVIQAFIQAGAPADVFGYYPTDHGGATEILLRSGRSMLFGDASTVRAWGKDTRVQLHGPGWSKIIIAADEVDNWEQYIDVMVDSILINSGRSCLNTSGIWVPKFAREISEALSRRLAQVRARSMDDENAEIAAFVNPIVARRTSELVDRGLYEGGAEEVTAQYREGGRLVQHDGYTFLLPTIVRCDKATHPLANTELLFPFASVVESPQDRLLDDIDSTLVLTVISKDDRFIGQALAARNVDRLNIGPVPTTKVSWDQPHEGNLFEHLYKQRALQLSRA